MDKFVDALIKDPARVKPDFIPVPNMDKVVSVLMRLAMENSVLRDRLARQEDLLISSGVLSESDFENFMPSQQFAAQSQAESFELIRSIVKDLE